MSFTVGEFGFDNIETTWWALAITLLVVVALVALVIFAIGHTQIDGEPFKIETRDLTYASVCVAIAFALSWFGWSLPAGGTITIISSLPIMIYCYYFGFRRGLVVCTVYMLLQFLQNPYIISPWSTLLDYVIPYMSMVSVGIFSFKSNKQNKANKPKYEIASHLKFFVGALIYITIRYTSHVISGIIFFDTTLAFSLSYNSFVLVDFGIAILGAILLLSSRSFNIFMTRKFHKNKQVAQ